MQKLKLTLLISLLSSAFLFASPADAVKQYTLENGLSVFLLEDSSEALIHVEVAIKAGFSSQTQNTAGFFYLYSDLIQNNNKIAFESVTCNADSSRYSLTTTPSNLEQTLQTMSEVIYSADYSDEDLSKELNKLKKQSEENSQSLSGFLNSAIEARIYSNAPWKHDTGIYPALFKKNTVKTARTTLMQISDRWYTPKNSAIFISGNFNSEKVLTSLRNSFGRYYSAYTTPSTLSDSPYNSKKNFIIHSQEFSPEITQLVIEYTNLSMDQCDLLACVLNNNYSSFKEKLLSSTELNIPGADYIDVSSVHAKDSSRLVIQALLQKAEDKNSKTSSLNQIQEFVKIVKQIPELISQEEFIFAKQQLELNLKEMTSTSTKMMDTLASFWIIEPYKNFLEEDLIYFPSSATTNLLMLQPQMYSQLELQPITVNLNSEDPFVFAVISDSDYKKLKKDYTSAGFDEVTSKNASWHTMQLAKEIQDQFKPDEEVIYNLKRSDYNDNDFYSRNIPEVQTTELSNGIKITTKSNNISTGLSMLIAIKGGKINSANDHGFEEVMVNILGTLIQREIYNKRAAGIILGNPEVSTQTDLYTSYILISFDKDDFEAICSAASSSLIFANLIPAAADRAVSSRQYKKRLENGSAVNQLFDSALKTIYGQSDMSKIYDSKKDILQDTNYTKIINAYPDLLDAGRYSIILSGNIPSGYKESLEKNFGQLTQNKTSLNKPVLTENFPESKSQLVQITHTFLTDIPAEKAGPQPAILIPTTEFLDPVMYVFKAPDADSADYALFNSLLNYIACKLQEEINSNSKISNSTVMVQLPKANLNYGFIIVQNVSHTAELDSVYRKLIEKITSKMNGAISTEIKNLWIETQFQNTSVPSQTAKLLYRGIELFPDSQRPDFYLEEYNIISQANAQDYLLIMPHFPPVPNYRLYSKDGKK